MNQSNQRPHPIVELNGDNNGLYNQVLQIRQWMLRNKTEVGYTRVVDYEFLFSFINF